MYETLSHCPLGKTLPYVPYYDPSLLFPILRADSRASLGIENNPPFEGVDIWNAYELSWINPKGKPMAAVAEFYVPCHSKYLFESKSLKLYLHSYNQTKFASPDLVQQTLAKDLSVLCQETVEVHVKQAGSFHGIDIEDFEGVCLDDLDVEISTYTVDPALLKLGKGHVEEKLHSHLLKSNCLVTNQPDWGHLQIHYRGIQIDHASLLKYIVSYREHNEFHEQCIERIFLDILRHCSPEKLAVYGRYTRRGGIDINPYRSNWEHPFYPNPRLFRQ